jgi:hypothetical protein
MTRPPYAQRIFTVGVIQHQAVSVPLPNMRNLVCLHGRSGEGDERAGTRQVPSALRLLRLSGGGRKLRGMSAVRGRAWLAVAIVAAQPEAGASIGRTDDFSYNIEADAVHVHDFHATILHLLGSDHTRLTFRFQGRDFRLTDVHGRVVRDAIA